jgi:hypothetical protein
MGPVSERFPLIPLQYWRYLPLNHSGNPGVKLRILPGCVNGKRSGVGCDGLVMSGGNPITLHPGNLHITGNNIHDFAR